MSTSQSPTNILCYYDNAVGTRCVVKTKFDSANFAKALGKPIATGCTGYKGIATTAYSNLLTASKYFKTNALCTSANGFLCTFTPGMFESVLTCTPQSNVSYKEIEVITNTEGKVTEKKKTNVWVDIGAGIFIAQQAGVFGLKGYHISEAVKKGIAKSKSVEGGETEPETVGNEIAEQAATDAGEDIIDGGFDG